MCSLIMAVLSICSNIIKKYVFLNFITSINIIDTTHYKLYILYLKHLIEEKKNTRNKYEKISLVEFSFERRIFK